MGREEKRLRERTIKQLTKRLQREPNEEEIDKEIAGFHKAQGLAPNRDRKV
jgi:DNA-directed RNA polymerase specialized sigma subunit